PQMAIALVHHPIVDREKKIVATNITNFDIHDIARASTVYGVDKYFIVHPMKEQLMFVERILDHWRVGQGAKFNPYRKTALNPVRTAEDIAKAIDAWKRESQIIEDPVIIATHARAVNGAKPLTFDGARDLLWTQKKPVFVIFGTGFGLTDEFMTNCHYVLESIKGAPPRDYRHLSVRSAVSICLDRLLGPW
ncbi:MAG: RNA methyltransferase, partial [Bdellovibrionaceae bacterium]|nr:RNA methyltransferase [Pseudobdellovibrionaceae bacterium]